ncbi:hypothetical protein MKX01_007058 [Papaver californicum]|nr:hypothetical protein MKX01_007058 [Papaver californicum]
MLRFNHVIMFFILIVLILGLFLNLLVLTAAVTLKIWSLELRSNQAMVDSENRFSIPLVQNSEQVNDGINPDNETNQLNTSEDTLRSINRPVGKYPRSHSTGHSLIRQGLQNSERYTLRLPDDVRNGILTRRSLNCQPVSGGSSHRGRGGSGGSESSNRGKNLMTSLLDKWLVLWHRGFLRGVLLTSSFMVDIDVEAY